MTARAASTPKGATSSGKKSASTRKAAQTSTAKSSSVVQRETSAAPEKPRASCACGGDCPRCQQGDAAQNSAIKTGAAKRPVSRAPNADAAEREARRLAPQILEATRAASAMPDEQFEERSGDTSAANAGLDTAEPRGNKAVSYIENADQPTSRQQLRVIVNPASSPFGRASTASPAGGNPAAKSAPVRAPPRRAALRSSSAPDRRLGGGRRLSRSQIQGFEAALEYDLRAVRIHYGQLAVGLAEQRQAVAFTYGTHIVLGREAQAVSARSLNTILAHEMVHVVQQSAPSQTAATSQWLHPHARAPPVRPALRTPLAPQNIDVIPGFVKDAAGATVRFGARTYHGAVDLGADVVEGAVELAEDVGDFALKVGGKVLKGAEAVVNHFAPGLLGFLRGDVLNDLTELFCSGLDTLVNLMLAPLAKIDIMSVLETVFRGLAAGVEATYSAIGSTASAALGILIQPLVQVIDVWGDDIISFVQGLSDGVSAVFTALWDNIAKPVLDFLGDIGGTVWTAFTDLVTWAWDLAKPVRDAAQWAWDWLMKKFGLAWDSSKGVRDWLEKKAKAAWKAFLKLIEPIKKPLMVVGGIILLLSPLGPILVLTQVLPPIWDKLKWLAANWKDTEVVVWAREILTEDILPFLIGAVDTVKSVVTSATSWLAGAVASIARGMQSIVSLFGSNKCLKSVNRVLEHIADQFDRLQAWAEGGFEGLADALNSAFDALRAIFQPILDFLIRLLIVAATPPLLPIAIVGAIWLLLPDEFKPPVIDFILGLMIAFLSGFPAFLTGLGPMASVLKSAVLGFLRHLKSGEGVDDETRIAAANKVANLAAGGGPQFIAGYAIGLLHGLIDGIIDPFKLLFMLFELIVTGLRVLGRVLAPYIEQHAGADVNQGLRAMNQALAVPDQGAATTATANKRPAGERVVTGRMTRAPPVAQTTNVAPPKVGQRHISSTTRDVDTTGTQARESPDAQIGAVAAEGAPVAEERVVGTLTRGLPDAEQEAGSGGGNADAADAVLDPAGLASDAEIAGQLSPNLIASVATDAPPEGVSADGLESEMRAEVIETGSTLSGLADLLGGAWDWMMQGAGRLGGRIASGLLKFLALPDYRLGRKIGWLSGMILLELLIAYFTAGGYTVLKQGASLGQKLLSYMLRFLDLGGEILGVLGRALKPLKGPIMKGFGAAKGFLSRFSFMRGIFSRIEGIARRIFRFGDEAAAAGSHVPVGRSATPAPSARIPDAPTPRVPDAPAPRVPDAPAPRVPDAPAPRAPDAPVPPRPVDGPSTGRAATETTQKAGDKAAKEAMDAVPTRQGRDAVEESGDGALRAVDEPGVPRVRDDALKTAQLVEAQIAARGVVSTNDVVDTPVPLVLGQLMVLKRRYRWIDTFRAERRGAGRYDFSMVASDHPIGRYTIDVNGREVEVIPVRRRGGGGEVDFRATPNDVPPQVRGRPEIETPRTRQPDPEVQSHIDETIAGLEQAVPVGSRPGAAFAETTARGQTSARAASIAADETHHLATQFGERSRRLFEQAFGGPRVRIGGTGGGLRHPIHHPINLIEQFAAHRQLRGWWTESGRFILRGHNPAYHNWVNRHLMAALNRQGLSRDQAFREFVRASLRLRRVIERVPEVLQYGPRILPPRLQNMAF